ncbi:zinc finger protein 420-like [Erpetoichthys calabaricus]|uniref:zinc finger protein 420-like n=1 Tax=Erpetoichthys calabaricus TaxID=27687 RepID=UPI0022341DF0|nr:zinc finger protein 420-like [Erpetoichthys calabaricus]
MDVKVETCEADINTMEIMTVSVKDEDCGRGFAQPKQGILCIKDEDYELGSVCIKEEVEEMSVSTETHKPKSVKPFDVRLRSESLASDRKTTEEIPSTGPEEDQASPTHQSEENLQDTGAICLSSFPLTSLQCIAKQTQQNENMKILISGSQLLTPTTLHWSSLPDLKLSRTDNTSTQPQRYNSNSSTLLFLEEQRERFKQKCKSNDKQNSSTGMKPPCCSELGEQFGKDGSPQLHTKIPTGQKAYHCYECGKEFTTSSSLKRHTRIHTGEKPYCCSECGKEFTASGTLKQHTRIHTGEKPFCCSECGKQFVNNSSLQLHTRTHTGQKAYCCYKCGKKFTTSGSLKRHTRIHTGEKPYCCFECGKEFTTSGILKRHIRIHTGEKPYCCSECGKEFTTSGTLKRHRRIHTGHKPFCCSECGKHFVNSSNFQLHKRIHTGNKPYCCSECGKQFLQIGHLQTHARIHTGQKPYCCSECGKEFSQIGHLQKHTLIHNGEKPHFCAECGKQFATSGTLKQHTRIHRGEKSGRSPGHLAQTVRRRWQGLVRRKWLSGEVLLKAEEGVVQRFLYRPLILLEALIIVICMSPIRSVGIPAHHFLQHSSGLRKQQHVIGNLDDGGCCRERGGGGNSGGFGKGGGCCCLRLISPPHIQLERMHLGPNFGGLAPEPFDVTALGYNSGNGNRASNVRCPYWLKPKSLLPLSTTDGLLHVGKEPGVGLQGVFIQHLAIFALPQVGCQHHDGIAKVMGQQPFKSLIPVLSKLELTGAVHQLGVPGVTACCPHVSPGLLLDHLGRLDPERHRAAQAFCLGDLDRLGGGLQGQFAGGHAAEKEKAAVYCNIRMDVKAESCVADTNIIEKRTLNVKDEDCEWESVCPKQESLGIKEEECEVGSLEIKEETEEKPVNIEIHPNKSVESVKEEDPHYGCQDESVITLVSSQGRHRSSVNVKSESLQSDTKGIEENTSVRTQEDQPPPRNKPYCCSECGKLFCHKSSLQKHKKIHTGEKPHCCLECGKQFYESSKLHRHRRIHTGEKPYCCLECGKQFRYSGHLQYHKRIHTGEKPYCCNECGKWFRYSSHLQCHKRIHTGEKPYCCSECGKRFFHKKNFQSHKRIHTGEKPYCCLECGKRFCSKSSLQSHTRTHTGEKPFSCLECGKQYYNKSYLKKHARIHTGKKP